MWFILTPKFLKPDQYTFKSSIKRYTKLLCSIVERIDEAKWVLEVQGRGRREIWYPL